MNKLTEYRREDDIELLFKYNKRRSYKFLMMNYHKDVPTLEEY